MESNPRNEEFIRLFNLFERLASQGSRNQSQHKQSTTGQDFPTISADLEPVVKNLAGVVGNRRSMEVDAPKTRQRPRSRTLSGSSPSEVNRVAQSLEHFPLNRDFRFTFTLMLHKLYQLDDWAEKVKQVLSSSRSEFKPLAEAMTELESKRKENPHSTPPSPHHPRPLNDILNHRRRLPLRLRARSLLTSHKRNHELTSPTIRSPTKAAVTEHKPVQDAGSLRVVKKRCIGRRKSEGNLVGHGSGKVGRAWVYTAAAAAREVRPRPTMLLNEPAFAARPLAGKYGGIGVEVAGRRLCHNRRAASIGGQAEVAKQAFIVRRWTTSLGDNREQIASVKAKRQREL